MVKIYLCNNIVIMCYLFVLKRRAQILLFTCGCDFTVHVPLEFDRILLYIKSSTEMSELSRANANWNACRHIGR